MQCTPKISIIVTYFDYARFIGETLESLRKQTYGNFEVVLVEDGGERLNEDQLNEWRRSLDVRLVRLAENSGLPVARNTGVEHSTGELLVFLDSDDCIEPTFLEECVDCLQTTSSDGIYTDVQMFGDTDFFWKPEVTLIRLLSGLPGPSTFLVKRTVFDAVGGFKEHLPQNSDHDFWIEAVSRGIPFSKIEKPLYHYRKHPHSMSTKGRTSWWEGLPRLVAEHEKLYQKHMAELLTAKEKQYRTMEEEYRHIYGQWQEAESRSQDITARYNELSNSRAFRIFQRLLDLKGTLLALTRGKSSTERDGPNIESNRP